MIELPTIIHSNLNVFGELSKEKIVKTESYDLWSICVLTEGFIDTYLRAFYSS